MDTKLSAYFAMLANRQLRLKKTNGKEITERVETRQFKHGTGGQKNETD